MNKSRSILCCVYKTPKPTENKLEIEPENAVA